MIVELKCETCDQIFLTVELHEFLNTPDLFAAEQIAVKHYMLGHLVKLNLKR